MKVIDLLNKIANGEKVPKVIYFWEREYIYDEEYNCYMHQTGANEFINLLDNDTDDSYYFLNDEVEIIEDKKIEKMWFSAYEMERVNKEVLEKIEKKTNEIIDYINGSDKE